MATTKKPSKRTKKPVSTPAPKDVVKDVIDLKFEIQKVEQEIVVAVKPVVKKVIPVLSTAKALFLLVVASIVGRGVPLKVRVARAIVGFWFVVMLLMIVAMLACVGPVGWTAMVVIAVFVWAVLNLEE